MGRNILGHNSPETLKNPMATIALDCPRDVSDGRLKTRAFWYVFGGRGRNKWRSGLIILLAKKHRRYPIGFLAAGALSLRGWGQRRESLDFRSSGHQLATVVSLLPGERGLTSSPNDAM